MDLRHMGRVVQGTPGTSVATQGSLSAPLNPEDSDNDAQQMSYPSCLTMMLDADTIDQLGLTGIPPAGTQFHIEGFGVVAYSSTSDPDSDGDIDHVCLSLQLTHMALEHEGMDEDDGDEGGPAERLYGPKGA